jgi:hypothetical protein
MEGASHSVSESIFRGGGTVPPAGGAVAVPGGCAVVRCFFSRDDASFLPPCGMENMDATEAAAITVERRIFFICRSFEGYPTMSALSESKPELRGTHDIFFKLFRELTRSQFWALGQWQFDRPNAGFAYADG